MSYNNPLCSCLDYPQAAPPCTVHRGSAFASGPSSLIIAGAMEDSDQARTGTSLPVTMVQGSSSVSVSNSRVTMAAGHLNQLEVNIAVNHSPPPAPTRRSFMGWLLGQESSPAHGVPQAPPLPPPSPQAPEASRSDPEVVPHPSPPQSSSSIAAESASESEGIEIVCIRLPRSTFVNLIPFTIDPLGRSGYPCTACPQLPTNTYALRDLCQSVVSPRARVPLRKS
jgi:hypothetical protein